jgi:hypothetical protein
MKPLALFGITLLFGFVAFAQKLTDTDVPAIQVQRDPGATASLATAISSLARSVPADSVATGTVEVTLGAHSEKGTITIRTRGLTQTSETLVLPSGTQKFVFDGDMASDNLNGGPEVRSAELAASAQSPMFPLPLLANAYSDNAFSAADLGPEVLDGTSTNHIRLTRTYADRRLSDLAALSRRDVWLDAKSGLPQRVSYARRTATGAEAPIRVDVFLSDYRDVDGVMYPFTIRKDLNGSLWADITIQSVTFNNGLSAADFVIKAGAR